MSYNSKYKGSEVEELLESIGGKVDKVDGKQLSTEDFTTLLKQKLDSLSNYDDTAIQESVSKLRTDLDTLVSGDTTTAIKTFNEVIAFLDGLEDTEDLASIIASIERQIAAKGTVTSITAGEGLTGGTITGEGTIALEELSAITMSGQGNSEIAVNATYLTASSNTARVVTGITVDKYGRVTKVTMGYVINKTVTGVKNFAGGTQVTLNGTNQGGKGVGLYAPTSKGSAGQVLVASSSGPVWRNIKTINGMSILDSGNIVIEGGSSSGSGAYAEVSHGTSDTTFTLTPNTFHVWDEVATLDLSFGAETSGVANEYLFQFTSGATATTLTLPSDIKWANDTTPTIAENKIYQISVLKGLASVLEFSNAAALITFYVNIGGAYRPFQCETGMTWQDFVNSEYNQGQYALSISGNNVAWSSFFISGQTSSDVIVDGTKYETYYND